MINRQPSFDEILCSQRQKEGTISCVRDRVTKQILGTGSDHKTILQEILAHPSPALLRNLGNLERGFLVDGEFRSYDCAWPEIPGMSEFYANRIKLER